MNRFIRKEIIDNIFLKSEEANSVGLILDDENNFNFPTNIKDTLNLFITSPVLIDNKSETLIVGLIRLYPNTEMVVKIPIIELIAVFARYRLKNIKFIPPILYKVYGFTNNNFIYKSTIPL